MELLSAYRLSEPDVVRDVWAGGITAAIVAAFLEVVLHCLTQRREASRFRLFPTSASGWVGYFLRTLILICILAMIFGQQRYIDRVVVAAALYSSLLLLISSAVFWRIERPLCIISVVTGITGLLVYQIISVVKET